LWITFSNMQPTNFQRFLIEFYFKTTACWNKAVFQWLQSIYLVNINFKRATWYNKYGCGVLLKGYWSNLYIIINIWKEAMLHIFSHMLYEKFRIFIRQYFSLTGSDFTVPTLSFSLQSYIFNYLEPKHSIQHRIFT